MDGWKWVVSVPFFSLWIFDFLFKTSFFEVGIVSEHVVHIVGTGSFPPVMKIFLAFFYRPSEEQTLIILQLAQG